MFDQNEVIFDCYLTIYTAHTHYTLFYYNVQEAHIIIIIHQVYEEKVWIGIILYV